MNYLLIVEGEKAEHILLASVFERYGFNVIPTNRIKTSASFASEFDSLQLSTSTTNIIIAQAPRNRLSELLINDSSQIDFDIAFRRKFNSIFLVFDVDHTSNTNLERVFNIHCDETDQGLLLVSSPCIEIMSEPRRKEIIKTDHISKYKKERNIYFHDSLKLGYGTIDYISKNFEKLSLEFLRLNYEEFRELNVMEHPSLVINMINKYNARTDTWVEYRYFTTVLYVLIANVFGLTKQIENYKIVEEFLEKHSRDQDND